MSKFYYLNHFLIYDWKGVLELFYLNVPRKSESTLLPIWGRLREGAESYAKALASDILR